MCDNFILPLKQEIKTIVCRHESSGIHLWVHSIVPFNHISIAHIFSNIVHPTMQSTLSLPNCLTNATSSIQRIPSAYIMGILCCSTNCPRRVTRSSLMPAPSCPPNAQGTPCNTETTEHDFQCYLSYAISIKITNKYVRWL